MVNFGPLTAEVCWRVWGIPANFNRFSTWLRYCTDVAQRRSTKHCRMFGRLLGWYTIHRESKKGCHPKHGYNFVSSWSICKILSLLQTAVNFQQNPCWVTRHTLSMLLHYLGKLKDQKFALCMHVKHVSSVIFYHLSNIYLPNVMKISAKINTMQNINITFCSFTVLNELKERLIVVTWFDVR